TLDASGTLAISQLTAYTNGTATINGRTETLTKLVDIDGASFVASGGAHVSLPAVTSYASGNGNSIRSLEASGSGSTLTLGALTSIPNSAYLTSFTIAAKQGGQVQLPALTTITASNNAAVSLSADGTGSTVNVSDLTTYLSGRNDYG